MLDVAGNNHSGAIPAGLGGLSSLEVLRLSGGRTGSIPTQLGGLSSLEVLHIHSDSLTGAIPTQLGGLTSLETLFISADGLTGAIPTQLGGLTSLETLWISAEGVTGSIPTGLGGLTALTTLYLSAALTGPIPTQITAIAGLQRLYLHNNALTGPIPAQLGGLNELTTLWLAGNDLRGPIPAVLGTAAALDVLDLRDNPLTWPAPTAVQDPREGLTVLLPDTAQWAPPPPSGVAAEAGNAAVGLSWTHPGAGEDFLVDSYTINYRSTDSTDTFTQAAASGSPVTIAGLTNGTEYHIFITATNTHATSSPSLTITAQPLATATQVAGFADVGAGSVHATAIAALADDDTFGNDGIFQRTRCSAGFCPNTALKRWEMAVWLVRALDGREPPATPSGFSDTAGAWYDRHVNGLADRGITSGCTDSTFCPNSAVTRAQMAVFLVRAFNIASAGSAGFTDVDSDYWAYNQINSIAAAGITSGCTASTFCPGSSTSRAQMATFIHRACNRYPTTCHYDDRPPPPIPSGPTIEDAVPGPGTVTVTWQRHSNDAGRTITRWQIRLNRITYTTNNSGITTETATPLLPLREVNATNGTADRHTHTIDELDFDTEYRIEVRGYFGSRGGTYSTPDKATTDPAGVRLVAPEVTQGLQNWNGDITLVKDKRTVVRAFLEPTSGGDATVNVELHAVSGGAVVASKTAPLNKIGGPPPGATYDKFTARPGASADRAMLGASANFRVDVEHSNSDAWVGSPTGQNNPSDPRADFSVTYRVVVPDGVICDAVVAEPDDSAAIGRACKVDLDFTYVNTPTVRLVGVGYDHGTGHTVPSRGELDEQAQRIMSLMPIPTLDYQLRVLDRTYSSRPVLVGRKLTVPDPLLNGLLLARANDRSTRVYLGVLSGESPGDIAGLANDFLANVAAWYVGDGNEGEMADGYSRNLVEFSADGGTTYETVAVNYGATSLVIGAGRLAGSDSAVARVTASDGLRTASASSPVFTLTKSAPEVYIHSPDQGRVHAGLATIVLDAGAHDAEDGALGASAISWSSSIDGQLATTGVAVIDTATLTAGTHVLTATATDSDNTTGTATVTVTVKATSEAPSAVDDTAYARGGSAVVDAAANDTDIEGDINPNTVRVVVPAALGTATAAHGSIRHTASAGSGYDTLIYEVCDRARGCDTAEVTVISAIRP